MDPEFVDALKEAPEGDAVDTEGARKRYLIRFRRIRRNEILATILFFGGIAGVLMAMAGAAGTDLLAPTNLGPFFILGALVTAFGGAGAMILNWHCPRCGHYLAQAKSVYLLYLPELTLRHCPHCGLRLQ